MFGWGAHFRGFAERGCTRVDQIWDKMTSQPTECRDLIRSGELGHYKTWQAKQLKVKIEPDVVSSVILKRPQAK